jgi:MOSC domain-containing protein
VWVQEIRRYPVKSMAGEFLKTADFTESGVVGDRIVQVRNTAGQVMTARTKPSLLRHSASLSADDQILVDGRPWTAEDVARDVEAAAGAGARLLSEA